MANNKHASATSHLVKESLHIIIKLLFFSHSPVGSASKQPIKKILS